MKLGLILAFACLAPAVAAEEVNLYTDRQETLLRPVLNAFERGERCQGQCSVCQEGPA